ncbi:type II secretion system F family protein [Streptomyces sp. F63]|uniref:type II secretion system F family protein n=1 Tax=Streptomyces sp. F63 TaxID=2824887 RepID=UPI0027DE8F75|nr:type II secretion system F family protein [Streptomyces sp. F63]
MTGVVDHAAPGAAWAALLCAGLAAWLSAAGQGRRRRARALLPGAVPVVHSPRVLRPYVRGWAAARAQWERTRRRLGQEWLCLPAGCLVGWLGDSPLPPLAALAAVPLVRRRLLRRDERRAGERRAAEVIEFCAVMAGELRAGRQPAEALLASPARPGPCQASVAAAARYGGDVAGALRQAARWPGAEGLAGVAACWQAAADTGAGLAGGLDRVAAALRTEREQREDLRAQLEGTRSTAALLALLPAFGLLMGTALGADPLRVLLHTPAGLACLVTGAALEFTGLAWTGRIVRAAERAGGSPSAAGERPRPSRPGRAERAEHSEYTDGPGIGRVPAAGRRRTT